MRKEITLEQLIETKKCKKYVKEKTKQMIGILDKSKNHNTIKKWEELYK